jgi:secernin
MCDSVVATRPETRAGTTLFAKNSDRHRGECQPFVRHPGAYHPRGAEVGCTHTTIPQVAETYATMGHSPWWVWGYEHGVNEHGVAIGNHTVFSNEPVEETPGLIGMDLVRLGLERGRNAREALEVVATLIEQHGQGGAAFGPGEGGYHNSFLIADPESAWVMETSGRRWAGKPVSLGALSNHITLRDDWAIGARDLESFARGMGWWRDLDRIDIAAAYRNPHVPGRISEGRRARATALLEAGQGKHDVASMKALLRDHGPDAALPPTQLTPDDDAYYTLCMHAEPIGTTTASMVAPLPIDRDAPWPVYVSFASPCCTVFLPVYLEAVLPAALARGHGERAADDLDSAWWIFHQLHEAVATDFDRHTPGVRAAFDDFEARVDGERGAVEAEAAQAQAAGEEDRARDVLSGCMDRGTAEAMDLAEALRAGIAT